MPLLTHNSLRLARRDITLSRLPAAMDGLRILQLSDLHFYEYTDPDYYERVIETANALTPDVVVVTGDVVHYGDQHLTLAGTYLSRIQSASSRLAILGNHDYQDGAESRHVRRIACRRPGAVAGTQS